MIKIIYERNNQPVAIWVTKRVFHKGVAQLMNQEDQSMFKCIVTALRIHSWVKVKVNDVVFRTLSGIMVGTFSTPKLKRVTLVPFRCDGMQFPTNKALSFSQNIQYIGDQLDTPVKKRFLRTGLWFSSLFGEGTIVGYKSRIYIIPIEKIGRFAADLRSKGREAFSGYESFEDPTVQYIDKNGFVIELDPEREVEPKRKWWKFWK